MYEGRSAGLWLRDMYGDANGNDQLLPWNDIIFGADVDGKVQIVGHVWVRKYKEGIAWACKHLDWTILSVIQPAPRRFTVLIKHGMQD